MNQALEVCAVAMDRRARRFHARLDGRKLDARYPLAYAFVLQHEDASAWRHPGLGENLTGQPYFVIRPESRPSTDPADPD
jgi:hypothetical protein